MSEKPTCTEAYKKIVQPKKNTRKLTDNFNLSEFVRSDSPKLTDYQIGLLSILASNLQVVRDELQIYATDPASPVIIKITSGVRTLEDVERLKKSGHNPSKTSDHLCGLQMTSSPTLGAADTIYKNCRLSCYEIAILIKELVLDEKCFFGQVIYEKNPATGSEWIHLSNDPCKVFQSNLAGYVHRSKFLKSLDNGKSYQPLF